MLLEIKEVKIIIRLLCLSNCLQVLKELVFINIFKMSSQALRISDSFILSAWLCMINGMSKVALVCAPIFFTYFYRSSQKKIIKSQLTINFMFPVPEASVPAVLICSDKSAPGNINSAMETL